MSRTCGFPTAGDLGPVARWWRRFIAQRLDELTDES